MDSYVAIYVPGGHGIVFDGSSSTTLKKLLEEAWTSDKIVSSVCHGPGALTTAKGADGKSILNGKQVSHTSGTGSLSRIGCVTIMLPVKQAPKKMVGRSAIAACSNCYWLAYFEKASPSKLARLLFREQSHLF